jgi:hypothetical protein
MVSKTDRICRRRRPCRLGWRWRRLWGLGNQDYDYDYDYEQDKHHLDDVEV